MAKIWKRCLKLIASAICAVAMCFSLLPTTVFAADNNVTSAINIGTFYQSSDYGNDFSPTGFYPYWSDGSVTLNDGGAQDRGDASAVAQS